MRAYRYLLLLLVWLPLMVSAETRLALVMGNGAYVHAKQLPNPPNDALAMANLLVKLGFKVLRYTDLNRQDMENAIDEFGRQAEQADVALVFYAGHGIQIKGNNYLIPVDAELDEERDVKRLIKLQDILAETSQAGMGIVILDACRNNPFAETLKRSLGTQRSVSVGRGLARVEKAENVLIAYATAADDTADDGQGVNSPFTTALLEHLPTPGVEIRLLFGQVKDAVVEATRPTGKVQRPFIYQSLGGEPFYFRAPEEQSTVLASPQLSTVDTAADERRLWDAAQTIPATAQKIAALQLYLSHYPQGVFAELAKLQIEALQTPVVAPSPPPDPNPAPISTPVPASALTRRPDEPEMVVVRGGTFLMGSPASEAGRYADERQHSVTVRSFALAKYEVTVSEFGQFVEATGYRTEAERNVDNEGCRGWRDGAWGWYAGLSWRNPGFSWEENHPVACVSWNDAVAYVRWLSQETGRRYRLPTEAEWEYAARGGSSSARYWGDSVDAGCGYVNAADQTAQVQFSDWVKIMNCRDNYVYTAPVGTYRENSYGLKDMLGNIWEWTCSKYNREYGDAEKECNNDANDSDPRVIRGGSWDTQPRNVRAALRNWGIPANRFYNTGFRLARSL